MSAEADATFVFAADVQPAVDEVRRGLREITSSVESANIGKVDLGLSSITDQISEVSGSAVTRIRELGVEMRRQLSAIGGSGANPTFNFGAQIKEQIREARDALVEFSKTSGLGGAGAAVDFRSIIENAVAPIRKEALDQVKSVTETGVQSGYFKGGSPNFSVDKTLRTADNQIQQAVQENFTAPFSGLRPRIEALAGRVQNLAVGDKLSRDDVKTINSALTDASPSGVAAGIRPFVTQNPDTGRRIFQSPYTGEPSVLGATGTRLSPATAQKELAAHSQRALPVDLVKTAGIILNPQAAAQGALPTESVAATQTPSEQLLSKIHGELKAGTAQRIPGMSNLVLSPTANEGKPGLVNVTASGNASLVTNQEVAYRATEKLAKQIQGLANAETEAAAKTTEAAQAQAEAAARTPGDAFFQGFFGAGGRKRRGGAQPIDQANFFNGLADTAGVVAKYEILGRGIASVGTIAIGTLRSFTELNQATLLLNEQLGNGAQVSGSYINGLQSIANTAGESVVGAIQAATIGIGAFSNANTTAAQKEAIGSSFAAQSVQLGVISGQTPAEAATALVAANSAYGLGPGSNRINNALANAKESYGGNLKQIAAGFTSTAVVGQKAGYSPEELANLVSAITTKTGDAGTSVGSSLERIFSTLETTSGRSQVASFGVNNTSGSVKDIISQLAQIYQHSGQALQNDITAQIGGRHSRELGILLGSQSGSGALAAQYQGANKKSVTDTTAALQEQNAIINSIAGRLRTLGAEFKSIGLDFARSGLLTPLIALLAPLDLIVSGVRSALQLFAGFSGVAGAIRDVVVPLVEVVAAFQALRVLSQTEVFAGLAGLNPLKGGFGPLSASSRAARAAGANEGLFANPFKRYRTLDSTAQVAGNGAAEAAATGEDALATAATAAATSLESLSTAVAAIYEQLQAQSVAIGEATVERTAAETAEAGAIITATAERTVVEDAENAAIIEGTAGKVLGGLGGGVAAADAAAAGGAVSAGRAAAEARAATAAAGTGADAAAGAAVDAAGTATAVGGTALAAGLIPAITGAASAIGGFLLSPAVLAIGGLAGADQIYRAGQANHAATLAANQVQNLAPPADTPSALTSRAIALNKAANALPGGTKRSFFGSIGHFITNGLTNDFVNNPIGNFLGLKSHHDPVNRIHVMRQAANDFLHKANEIRVAHQKGVDALSANRISGTTFGTTFDNGLNGVTATLQTLTARGADASDAFNYLGGVLEQVASGARTITPQNLDLIAAAAPGQAQALGAAQANLTALNGTGPGSSNSIALNAAQHTLANLEKRKNQLIGAGLHGKGLDSVNQAIVADKLAVATAAEQQAQALAGLAAALVSPFDPAGQIKAQLSAIPAELAAAKDPAQKLALTTSAAQLANQQVQQTLTDTTAFIKTGNGAGIDPRQTTAVTASALTAAQNTLSQLKAHHATGAKLFNAQQAVVTANADNIKTQVQLANAGVAASVFPGSTVEAAAASLREASNSLNADIVGTQQYATDLLAYRTSQVAFAQATASAAIDAQSLSQDLSNPIVLAQIALRKALAKLNVDSHQKNVPQDVITQDTLAVKQKQLALNNTAFQQNLSIAASEYKLGQSAEFAGQAGTLSFNAYIKLLKGQEANLNGIKNKTQQQKNQLIAVDQAILTATNQMQGQFNIGKIKVPAIYQARRELASQAAGTSYQAQTQQTVYVSINGSDTGKVKQYLGSLLGPSALRTRGTVGRKVA